MTVTEDFECVTTKDGYELYVRKVCPIRKNDASRLQDLVSNGTEALIFKQAYGSPTLTLK